MAEADPALVYSGYGYPYSYGHHFCVNAANQAVPCAGAPLAYAGYPYGAYAGYNGAYAGYAGYPFGHLPYQLVAPAAKAE